MTVDDWPGLPRPPVQPPQNGKRSSGQQWLLDAGRVLAAEAGVEAEWVHDRVARELARVLVPGGRMGLCSWTPTAQSPS